MWGNYNIIEEPSVQQIEKFLEVYKIYNAIWNASMNKRRNVSSSSSLLHLRQQAISAVRYQNTINKCAVVNICNRLFHLLNFCCVKCQEQNINSAITMLDEEEMQRRGFEVDIKFNEMKIFLFDHIF